MSSEKFEEAVAEIEQKNNEKVDPRLDPTKNALEELGNPEEDYKVVLVGGTNGKGSVVEMISEMLEKKGFKVGKYKSPYLTTIREEFKLNDKKISEERFLELYKSIDQISDGLTFFEFKTVMAYLYFSQEEVDYAIMEVGMGGKFDATNVVNNELSVVTNVAKDHTEYLGDTVEEIAEEIASITPKKGKLVTSSENPVIDEIVENKSAEIVKPETVELDDGKFFYRGESFKIPIEGDFQAENLENALTAVKQLEDLPKDIEYALSDLENPARMEVISERPKIILDGAHNPHGLERTIKEYPDNFKCIFAGVETKDIQKNINILERKASKFYITDAGVDWAEKPEKIAEYVSKPVKIFSKPFTAFEKAKQELDEDETLIVTGSLYMIGNLKKIINSNLEE